MLAQEVPRQLAATPASLGIVIIECLRMSGLQEIVLFGAVRIREADKLPHRVHSWRAGKESISALLAEVLLCCPRFMHYCSTLVECLREVNCRLSLMTRFAKHKNRLTPALTDARPVTFKLETERDPGVQCRARVRACRI